MNNNSSINNKLNSNNIILLELNDTNPNIRNRDINNSSSNIKKWKIINQ